MRGNVFFSLNEATYNSLIPTALVASCGWQEENEEGVITDVHPTFAQVAERNRSKHGVVRTFQKNGENFYIIEIIASWLTGEVSELLHLGEGLPFPSNTLLTVNEAQELLEQYASVDP